MVSRLMRGVGQWVKGAAKSLKVKNCWMQVLGSAILAFGLSNIHAFSGVTEGGVLGLTLLLRYLIGLSPAVSNFVLTALCYLLGWRTLGRDFIAYSAISCIGYSVFYAIFEKFAPIFPALCASPLWSALVGALFVGIGVGLCVRYGGAPGGDDALAMSLSSITKLDIQWIYLGSDLIVLALSTIYIPLKTLVFSLLTVILSGQLIGIVQRADMNALKARLHR